MTSTATNRACATMLKRESSYIIRLHCHTATGEVGGTKGMSSAIDLRWGCQKRLAEE